MPGALTVTALPKAQQADFNDNPMVVLLSSGQLVGWGDNTTGALANGIAAATNQPAQKVLFDPDTTLPPLGATIVDWAFTNANLYVVYSNGWVYSAGQNTYGQLGHGDTVARQWLNRIDYFPTHFPSLSVTGVWAFGGHTTTDGGGCVYFQATDNSMYACGLGLAGNLGNSTSPTSNLSTPSPCTFFDYPTSGVTDIVAVTLGTNVSTYILFDNGYLFVAGYNGQGQLGINSTSNLAGGFFAIQSFVGPQTVVAVSANGGGTTGGNALFLNSAGLMYTTGYNGHGELGQGVPVDTEIWESIFDLQPIAQAGLGGGLYGYGYALSTSGTFYTWGYNGQNNLFQNNSTTPQSSPVAVSSSNIPTGVIQSVYMAKGEAGLSTTAQMILLMSTGVLAYAGEDNGQLSVPVTSGAYNLIPAPRQLLDGRETILDLFVHGTSATQRWFILTDLGNLYACGSNVDSICTGGVSSNVINANAAWLEISFS